jgi:hypothetical protein
MKASNRQYMLRRSGASVAKGYLKNYELRMARVAYLCHQIRFSRLLSFRLKKKRRNDRSRQQRKLLSRRSNKRSKNKI